MFAVSRRLDLTLFASLSLILILAVCPCNDLDLGNMPLGLIPRAYIKESTIYLCLSTSLISNHSLYYPHTINNSYSAYPVGTWRFYLIGLFYFPCLVCSHLVANGEKQDEEVSGGQHRAKALLSLCQMNQEQTLPVRALCVSSFYYIIGTCVGDGEAIPDSEF